jgi:hypothetical protein
MNVANSGSCVLMFQAHLDPSKPQYFNSSINLDNYDETNLGSGTDKSAHSFNPASFDPEDAWRRFLRADCTFHAMMHTQSTEPEMWFPGTVINRSEPAIPQGELEANCLKTCGYNLAFAEYIKMSAEH